MSTVSIEPSHVMIKEQASHNIVVWFHFRNTLHHFKNLLRIWGMVQGVFCRIIPKIYPIYPYVLIRDMLFCFSIISLQIVLHNACYERCLFYNSKKRKIATGYFLYFLHSIVTRTILSRYHISTCIPFARYIIYPRKTPQCSFSKKYETPRNIFANNHSRMCELDLDLVRGSITIIFDQHQTNCKCIFIEHHTTCPYCPPANIQGKYEVR